MGFQNLIPPGGLQTQSFSHPGAKIYVTQPCWLYFDPLLPPMGPPQFPNNQLLERYIAASLISGRFNEESASASTASASASAASAVSRSAEWCDLLGDHWTCSDQGCCCCCPVYWYQVCCADGERCALNEEACG